MGNLIKSFITKYFAQSMLCLQSVSFFLYWGIFNS